MYLPRARGLFLCLVVFTSGAGCRASLPSPASDSRAGISRTVDELLTLRSDEPTLPGVAYSDSLAAVVLADRSSSDTALLAGRLYYDLANRIGDAPGERDSGPALRALLAAPPRGGRITRAGADGLLSETRARSSVDPVFRKEIQDGAQYVLWGGSMSRACKDSQGYVMPITYCRLSTMAILHAANWWGP